MLVSLTSSSSPFFYNVRGKEQGLFLTQPSPNETPRCYHTACFSEAEKNFQLEPLSQIYTAFYMPAFEFSGHNRRLRVLAGIGVTAARLWQSGHSQGHSIHTALHLWALLLWPVATEKVSYEPHRGIRISATHSPATWGTSCVPSSAVACMPFSASAVKPSLVMLFISPGAPPSAPHPHAPSLPFCQCPSPGTGFHAADWWLRRRCRSCRSWAPRGSIPSPGFVRIQKWVAKKEATSNSANQSDPRWRVVDASHLSSSPLPCA